jgi:hypothetical protein
LSIEWANVSASSNKEARQDQETLEFIYSSRFSSLLALLASVMYNVLFKFTFVYSNNLVHHLAFFYKEKGGSFTNIPASSHVRGLSYVNFQENNFH